MKNTLRKKSCDIIPLSHRHCFFWVTFMPELRAKVPSVDTTRGERPKRSCKNASNYLDSALSISFEE
jgi:hypothetical protein